MFLWNLTLFVYWVLYYGLLIVSCLTFLMSFLGSRGYWTWPENPTCAWAWWTCYEMRARSKCKPCYSKVYWMHSCGENSVYYCCFQKPSCYAFYSSLWLPCYSGNICVRGDSIFMTSSLYWAFTFFLFCYREFWSIVQMICSVLLMKFWNLLMILLKINMATMSHRLVILHS